MEQHGSMKASILGMCLGLATACGSSATVRASQPAPTASTPLRGIAPDRSSPGSSGSPKQASWLPAGFVLTHINTIAAPQGRTSNILAYYAGSADGPAHREIILNVITGGPDSASDIAREAQVPNASPATVQGYAAAHYRAGSESGLKWTDGAVTIVITGKNVDDPTLQRVAEGVR